MLFLPWGQLLPKPERQMVVQGAMTTTGDTSTDGSTGSHDHNSRNRCRNLNYGCNFSTIGGSTQTHPGGKPQGDPGIV